jgi:hypothetical protein
MSGGLSAAEATIANASKQADLINATRIASNENELSDRWRERAWIAMGVFS